MKKCYTILLTACLLLLLLPCAAMADPLTETFGNEDSGYYWDASEKTLTLTNFSLNVENIEDNKAHTLFSLPDGAVIVLEGESEILCDTDCKAFCVIDCEGSLTIQGGGRLDICCKNTDYCCGINVRGDLTILSGTVSVEARGAEAIGVYLYMESDECPTLTVDSELDTVGSESGICGNEALRIAGSGSIYASPADTEPGLFGVNAGDGLTLACRYLEMRGTGLPVMTAPDGLDLPQSYTLKDGNGNDVLPEQVMALMPGTPLIFTTPAGSGSTVSGGSLGIVIGFAGIAVIVIGVVLLLAVRGKNSGAAA